MIASNKQKISFQLVQVSIRVSSAFNARLTYTVYSTKKYKNIITRKENVLKYFCGVIFLSFIKLLMQDDYLTVFSSRKISLRQLQNILIRNNVIRNRSVWTQNHMIIMSLVKSQHNFHTSTRQVEVWNQVFALHKT